jgi:cellulose synthase/poly-beta-1,6-N-acetylglucosamine synthase-like glycosyltransferase
MAESEVNKTRMKKLIISIGIPAFNEEANIKKLLQTLLSQLAKYYTLKELFVYSDGSTDNTVKEVTSLENKKIKLFAGKKRIGQQEIQNIFLKKFSADVLVIIEADTLPYNNYTLDELVKPLLDQNSQGIGMVVGQAMGSKPQSFIERCMFFGEKMKGDVFTKWRNGNNIFMSGGHAMRAFTKEFSQVLSFPKHVPEDSYAYLVMKKHGLKLVKNSKAKVLVGNIGTVSDAISQNKKYVSGKKALEKYFDQDFLMSEFNYSKRILCKHILMNMFTSPLLMFGYVAIVIANKITNVTVSKYSSFYKPYLSSKQLRVDKN